MVGAKPMAELLIALALLRLFPEKGSPPWSAKLVSLLLLFAVGLGIFWVIVFAWGNTTFPDTSKFGGLAIFVGAASAVLTAPIFEEKVVRDLLLRGLSGYLKPWISATLVSALFALAHISAIAWTFIVSMALCWLAIKWKIGTLQRAIVHGAVNALIMLWYFTSGFGFFV